MSNIITPSEPLTVVFAVYPDMTHLDFTGPHQIFARLPNAKPIVASVTGEPVDADGLVFSDLAPLEKIERCDVLCVPGGFGCIAAMENPNYLSAVRRLAGT